jgi:hypothetical protein
MFFSRFWLFLKLCVFDVIETACSKALSSCCGKETESSDIDAVKLLYEGIRHAFVSILIRFQFMP